jgi:hypothetical protein
MGVIIAYMLVILSDTLSLGGKFCFEKIHHRYCKTILGIRKTACNLAAKTELGRFPLDSFIKTLVMMHYSRIHSDKINPLIKEAFNLNKYMHDNGIFTWCTFAKEIFAESSQLSLCCQITCSFSNT